MYNNHEDLTESYPKGELSWLMKREADLKAASREAARHSEEKTVCILQQTRTESRSCYEN